MMVKSAITVAIFVGSLVHARAADVTEPPPVPSTQRVFSSAPSFSWSSFYIGANAGYGWADAAWATTITDPFGFATTAVASGSTDGAVAGGQVGFNWQADIWVFGAEVDWQKSWQNTTSTTSCGFGCTFTEKSGIDWFGTARLRFGTAYDRVLFYGTGGLAWTGASDNVTSAFLNPSITANKVGWTVGTGVEWAFANNWSVKAEYLFIATRGLTGSTALGMGTVAEIVNINDSLVRVGINFRVPVGRP